MANEERLEKWKRRLRTAESAYQAELDKMDRREAVYQGDRTLLQRVKGDRKKKTPHVRNLTAEIVEAEVNSAIPQPKVTAKRQQDERRAKIIEDMLRNELDRLPFETINDLMERIVPIQGGGPYLVEWDNRQRTHTTVGELAVTGLHPKQLIPQPGVYTGIPDMDYLFLKLPQTKDGILQRYGVDVSDQGEDDPDKRGSGAVEPAEDLVTQVVVYYRNGRGGIGKYSWVNNVELEDLEDYQARRLKRCVRCGEAEPLDFVGADGDGEKKSSVKKCPVCGGTKWEDQEESEEEIWEPILLDDGRVIPGARPMAVPDEPILEGAETAPVMATVLAPTRIPRYKPDAFPVVLQKNVSVFGKFLGDSDVDKIADQQNTVNRIEAKIIDKLTKSGSYITLPVDSSVRFDPEDMKPIRLRGPQDAAQIDVKNLEGEIQQDMAYLAQVYEEARQTIGITDSFQGRRDTTATSGKAKEFSASQAAGRLQSKQVMKEAAYAALFELMFKFRLAYDDDRRPVTSTDAHGKTVYEEFNRYDFLEQDATGEWYWNDQFLFSCDTTAALANNREAMWQETTQNFQSGSFGDPTDMRTLIMYWGMMDRLHYPMAKETKAMLEERMAQQLEAQQAQAAQQQMQQLPPQAGMPPQ